MFIEVLLKEIIHVKKLYAFNQSLLLIRGVIQYNKKEYYNPYDKKQKK